MAGAAALFVEKLVGGVFAVRERDVTLGVAEVEILRNDPERVGWIIINTGAVTAQVSFNAVITTATAILIASVGGSFSANVQEDFVMTAFSMHGNTAAGVTTLHIVEIVRQSAPVEGG